ncbi:MAG: DUF4080 domain-containing protein [Bdellovibrionia bacterium]
MQTDIILSTLNSSYQHSSFGLRYLKANLGELQSQCEIIEFTIQKEPRDIVEQILLRNPRIVGFGVYIWNTTEIQKVITVLKKVRPEIVIVLGGPEVSYESETQAITQVADYVIKGEADFEFRDLCNKILNTESLPQKFIQAALPDIKKIITPYHLYSDEDIKNRYIYVEASRGCPYKCEYCLSSLDKSVRSFDVESFLQQLQTLIDRGARSFKFIDRTFNLSIPTCTQILQFFLDRVDLGLFLHFEMVPDRLPQEIRDFLVKFPAGSLQFEIGIQTFNPEVAKNVSRRNDFNKVKENFEFLATHTGVHTHADLIVGLPGETLESFAVGFDTLWSYNPHEIQVGILKRLKGTPIIRHDANFKMVYSEHPPFQILQNKDLDFNTLQVMNRFAKFWDLIANSGQFPQTLKYLERLSESHPQKSFFWQFYDLSQFLSRLFDKNHSIALMNLAHGIYKYLLECSDLSADSAAQLIVEDYSKHGKRDIPNFLKFGNSTSPDTSTATATHNKRQKRHLHNQTETSTN